MLDTHEADRQNVPTIERAYLTPVSKASPGARILDNCSRNPGTEHGAVTEHQTLMANIISII